MYADVMEKIEFTDDKLTLPKGKYLAIDPCYILGEDPFWQKYCNWMFSRGDYNTRVEYHFIKYEDKQIYVFDTAFGDGCYPVLNAGHEIGSCGVDAGMICLCPVELLDELGVCSNGLGTFVELEDDAEPKYVEGNVMCGNLSIVTNFDDEDEEEDCDYCGNCGIEIDGSCQEWCDDCEAELEEEDGEEE